MENYDRTLELVETAQDSAGKSSEQFAKYSDTLEYKLNKLSTTWEQFRTNLIQSDVFKNVVDQITKLVERLNEFDLKELLVIIPTFVILGKQIVETLIQTISQSASRFQSVGKAIGNSIAKGIQQSTSGISGRISQRFYGTSSGTNVLNQEELNAKIAVRDDLNKRIESYRINGGVIVPKDIQKRDELNKQINETIELRKKEALVSQSVQQGLQAVGQATSVLTMALMVGADASQAFEAALISIGASGAQVVMQFATTFVSEMAVAGTSAGTALSTAFAATGPGLIIVLITAAIAAAGWGASKLIENFEESQRAIAENNSALLSAEKAIETLTEKQEELSEATGKATEKAEEQKETYNNLKEGAESLQEYEEKMALTSEETQKYIDLQNELAEKFPDLIKYYDEQGNAIMQMSSAWDEAIKKQQQYYAEAEQEEAKANLTEKGANLALVRAQQQQADATADALNKNIDTLKAFSNLRAENLGIDYAFRWNGNNFERANTMEDESRKLVNLPGLGLHDYIQFTTGNNKASALGVLKGWKDSLDGLDADAETVDAVTDQLNALRAVIGQYSGTSTDIQNLKDLDTDKLLDKLIDFAGSNQVVFQEIQEYLADFNYEAYIAENYVSDIAQKEKEFNEALSKYVSADLLASDEFINASKNVQAVAVQYAQDQADFNQKTLEQKFLATEVGEKFAEYNETTGEYDFKENVDWDLYYKLFDEFIQNSKEIGDAEAEIIGQLNQETQDAIDQLYKEFDKSAKNELDRVKLIDSSSFSDDIKQSIYNLEEASIELYNQDMKYLAELIGGGYNVNEELGGIIELSSEFGQQLQGLNDSSLNNLINTLRDLNTDNQRKDYLSDLSNLGLGQDLSTALEFDWSKVNMINKEAMKEQFIDSLAGNYTEEEKKKIAEAVFDFEGEHGQIPITVTNLQEFESQVIEPLKEVLTEGDKNIKNQIDAYKSAATSQKEKGYVDIESLEGLTEAGLDVSKFVDNNLQLDREGLNQYLKDLLNGDAELLNQQKQEALARLEALKVMKQQLQGYHQLQAEQLTLNRLISDSSITTQHAAESVYNELIANDGRLEWIDEAITLQEEYVDKIDETSEADRLLLKATLGYLYEANDEIDKSVENNSEKIQEAQQDIIDKQKELNEVLYGTEYFTSASDLLYNYTTALEKVQNAANDTKEALEELDGTDKGELFGQYANELQQEANLIEAQNWVIRQSINNIEQQVTSGLRQKLQELNALNPSYNISTDTSDFFKFDETTSRYIIDFDKIDSTKMNDDLKKWVVDQLEQLNEYQEALEDNEKIEKDRRKEIEDMREKYLDDYVSLEDKVLDTLKEKYQEEINATKDKYEAMSDADNDYLDALEDAIDRQRQIRDNENKWNDLAQKERKLSLMQRDTSGGNQSETLKLTQEIEEDRQDLLDDQVDTILDNLKQTYELQKEWRDKEVELLELQLDEAALSREASSIVSSWQSPEDVMNWFYDNTKDLPNWSNAKLEQEMMEWRSYYDQKNLYDNFDESSLKAALVANEESVSSILGTYIQNAVTDPENTLNSTVSEVKTDIEEAQNALNEAREKLNEISTNTSSSSSTLKDIFSSMDDSNSQKPTDIPGIDEGGIIDGDLKEKPKTKTRAEELTEAYVVAKGQIGSAASMIMDTAQREGYVWNQNQGKFIEKTKVSNDSDKTTSTTSTTSKTSSTQPHYDSVNMEELYPSKQTSTTTTTTTSTTTAPFGSVDLYKNEKGGLINFTGPTWVDGTKANPEAFLSSEDTRRIGEAAKLLSNIPILNNSSSINEPKSQIVGDTNIEVHINVEEISSDYDVDQAVERVKYDILKAANPQGSSIILTR